VPEAPERFSLLASAIAGRTVGVAASEGDGPSWTDGTTIYLDRALGVDDTLSAVAVQAALLGAGSLGAEQVEQLGRRAAPTRRYLSLEGHRALAAAETVVPMAVRSCIDRTLAARTDSPSTSLGIATGRESLPDPPAYFGTIKPRHVRQEAEGAGNAAAETHHAPRREERTTLRELEDGDDDAGTDLFSSPVGGSGIIGRALKKLFGDSRTSQGGPPGADAPTHWAWPTSQRRGVTAVSSASASFEPGVASPVPASVTYPEWDVHRHCYRPEWCTVTELPVEPGDADARGVAVNPRLRRALTRLGLELERRDHELQGIDIDVDAVVAARVATVSGGAPDDRVYVDLLRRRRDLSVLVLLDVSGSAGEPSAGGGSVHDHQASAAAQLVTTLERLGDRVALYAFRSQGRTAVHVLPVKRFGESFDLSASRRLAACRPGAYTRLGAAIRHGAAVLDRDAGTARRLLVVLSDGFAYDHGYEGRYGEADARRGLAEARRSGTGCLCLSIGAATDPVALRRVFGTAAHACLARVDHLPEAVGRLFGVALGSADVQRRAYQHRRRGRERLDVERRSA
jgi:hypothetical protein